MAWIQPIFDRTIADVDALKKLAKDIKIIGWENATTIQQDEWLYGTNKGAVNYVDLNRIQTDILYLRDDLLNTYGISVILDESNPTWVVGDELFISNMNVIRDNIIILVNAYFLPLGLPIITYSNPLNVYNMNNIEENLQLLYELLISITLNFRYSGEINSGDTALI